MLSLLMFELLAILPPPREPREEKLAGSRLSRQKWRNRFGEIDLFDRFA
jgi:hypothetical protein